MIIKKVKQYDITFSVRYFEGSEKAMHEEIYGHYYDIADAVAALQRATDLHPSKMWLIVCTVNPSDDIIVE